MIAATAANSPAASHGVLRVGIERRPPFAVVERKAHPLHQSLQQIAAALPPQKHAPGHPPSARIPGAFSRALTGLEFPDGVK